VGGGCGWVKGGGGLQSHPRVIYTPPKIQQQQQHQLLNMISMKLPHTKQSQAGLKEANPQL